MEMIKRHFSYGLKKSKNYNSFNYDEGFEMTGTDEEFEAAKQELIDRVDDMVGSHEQKEEEKVIL